MGAVAGSLWRKVRRNGRVELYWRIGVGGRDYMSHRLAILWMTGEFPPAQVDHEQRATLDNRWEEATSGDQL